jgi:predicted HTH domain antitoxin
MAQLTLTIPNEIPQLLKMSEREFAQEAQLLLAVKLFELGKLTSGQAAALAGMPRVAFLTMLKRYNVPAINLEDEEIKYEIEAARRIGEWLNESESSILLP